MARAWSRLSLKGSLQGIAHEIEGDVRSSGKAATVFPGRVFR